jgi:hypothetical protein
MVVRKRAGKSKFENLTDHHLKVLEYHAVEWVEEAEGLRGSEFESDLKEAERTLRELREEITKRTLVKLRQEIAKRRLVKLRAGLRSK